jgi:metallo-beta-lactamase family protein
VHGEPRSARALADRIRSELGWNVVVPRLGERVRLDT